MDRITSRLTEEARIRTPNLQVSNSLKASLGSALGSSLRLEALNRNFLATKLEATSLRPAFKYRAVGQGRIPHNQSLVQ